MARFNNPIKKRVEDGDTGAIMGFLPEGVRNHLVAWLAEFAGTFLFLFFAFSIATVANTPPHVAGSHPLPDVSKLLYIALGFGCSVAINVWIFYRVSGGQFNPAVILSKRLSTCAFSDPSLQVTLTLWLVGAVPAIRCLVIMVAQILGGIAAAGVSSAVIPGPFSVNVRLGGGTSTVRGLFIEMFTTAMLVMTVIMLAAVKSRATWLAPIGIGIALFIGHLLSRYTQDNIGMNVADLLFAQASITRVLASIPLVRSDPTSSPVPFLVITGSIG